ncbi:MAG: IS1595 family transposase [Boseongicola sp. SB0675_bin_26]|nr:IS1595 family transposase [Boseongicola sp. SB0675_bin_26]
MAHKAPGRSHRKGITIVQLLKMFPDNDTAERWFEEQRWPNGERHCPDCGSVRYSVSKNRKPMPYRCKDCRAYFSVRKGTAMESSKIGFQDWAIAFYMMTTGIKGTSSMKLYREVGIRQATAWFMMQRIREGFMGGIDKPFPGPVEADETAIGGKVKNMSNRKRKERKEAGIGRGTAGKMIVAGVKDRETKMVSAAVVRNTDAPTLRAFVEDRTEETATVYTDDAGAYKGINRAHESVNHSAHEYVRGDVHTNGIEALWSLFKRGYHGTFHHISDQHLDRYVAEFEGRNNIRDMDTIDQMAFLARAIVGRRIKYDDLVAKAGAAA